ncbi:MAG: PIG-L deacetylase family protein [Promethearchaeota archaeon]
MVELLIFAAHPDDEGAMFSTIAKYARINPKCAKIFWATKGERWLTPFREFSPFLYWFIESKKNREIKEKLYQIIGKIREKEARSVLKILGIEGGFLGFRDGSIPYPDNLDVLKYIIEIIRKETPKVIATHHFSETHKDHKNLSHLIYQTFFLAGNRKIKTKSPPHNPKLLVWWDERGKLFKPNLYINISTTIDIFRKWKKIHKSQMNRIVGRFSRLKARYRAIGTPFKLAECFQIANKSPEKKIFAEFFPIS